MAAASDAHSLTGFLLTASSVGDLGVMWKQIAAVAPEEIRADAEAVAESWNSVTDTTTSRDYLSAFVNAVIASGSTERVNAYIYNNCGPQHAPLGNPNSSQPNPNASSIALDQELTDENGYSYRLILFGPGNFGHLALEGLLWTNVRDGQVELGADSHRREHQPSGHGGVGVPD